jgi:hypothetical protein
VLGVRLVVVRFDLVTVRCDFRAVAFFFTVEPDDTRLECRARWCTTFFGAASASEASIKTAATATSIVFKVLRII